MHPRTQHNRTQKRRNSNRHFGRGGAALPLHPTPNVRKRARSYSPVQSNKRPRQLNQVAEYQSPHVGLLHDSIVDDTASEDEYTESDNTLVRCPFFSLTLIVTLELGRLWPIQRFSFRCSNVVQYSAGNCTWI